EASPLLAACAVFERQTLTYHELMFRGPGAGEQALPTRPRLSKDKPLYRPLARLSKGKPSTTTNSCSEDPSAGEQAPYLLRKRLSEGRPLLTTCAAFERQTPYLPRTGFQKATWAT
ncbi:hypothetical protein BVRB_018080, partial [Beta vulgaris subsp. vulgaris]